MVANSSASVAACGSSPALLLSPPELIDALCLHVLSFPSTRWVERSRSNSRYAAIIALNLAGHGPLADARDVDGRRLVLEHCLIEVCCCPFARLQMGVSVHHPAYDREPRPRLLSRSASHRPLYAWPPVLPSSQALPPRRCCSHHCRARCCRRRRWRCWRRRGCAPAF